MSNTTKKSILWIVLSAGLAVVAGLVVLSGKKEGEAGGQKGSGETYSLYEAETGWGYDIFVDGNLFIRQPFIPVIAGERGFPDSTSAGKAARLMIGKLETGSPPSLTREEVERILNP